MGCRGSILACGESLCVGSHCRAGHKRGTDKSKNLFHIVGFM